MSKLLFRVLGAGIVLAMVINIAACNRSNTNGDKQPQTTSQGTAEKKAAVKQIEISVFDGRGEGSWVTNPPKDDKVSPAIAAATGVKVKTYYNKQGKPSIDESLTALVNSGSMPDLIYVNSDSYTSDSIRKLIDAGKILEINDAVKAKVPSIIKEVNPKFWSAKNHTDGKNYALPVIFSPTPNDLKDPEIAKREWMLAGQPIYVREDILAQLGYKFKPTTELEKKVQEGKWLDYNDMKVEGLETTEDFYNFLKKAKNLKIGDKPIIPLSTEWGELFTVPMFNIPFGYVSRFDYDKDGNVKFMTNNQNWKEACKYINMLYREGLLDKEFPVQTADQKMSKITSGQVAAWFCWGISDGGTKVRQSLKSANPNYEVRILNRITMPGSKELRQFNTSLMGGDVVYIKKDSEIDQILKYFEWCFTPEAEEIMGWGPKESGIWEMKDGKRVFKDPDLQKEAEAGTTVESGKGMSYYGMNFKMAPARRLVAKIATRPEANRLPSFFNLERKATNADNFFESDLAYFPKPKEVDDFDKKYYGKPPLIQKYFMPVFTCDKEADFDKVFDKAQKDFEAEGVLGAEKAYTEALKKYWSTMKK